MNLGVQQRCRDLQKNMVKPLPKKFMCLIPLVEVIVVSLDIKSIISKKVVQIYEVITSLFPSEIALWQSDEIENKLSGKIPDEVMKKITAVEIDKFAFDPLGYDGIYGKLVFR